MKRLYVAWLCATILITSCEKSENADSSLSFSKEQGPGNNGIGWHSYSVTVSTVNDVNTACSDLMLNVATDKTSRGKIVLYEYEGPNHHVVMHKWETTNANNAMMNAGKSDALQRYFDATFTWGSTIILSEAEVIEINSCTK